MNLRLLFTLPPKPPQQTNEQRRDDTARQVMRRQAHIDPLMPEELETRLNLACLIKDRLGEAE